MNKLDEKMKIDEYLDREKEYRVLNTLSKEELMSRYYSTKKRLLKVTLLAMFMSFLAGTIIG